MLNPNIAEEIWISKKVEEKVWKIWPLLSAIDIHVERVMSHIESLRKYSTNLKPIICANE